jgi:hypothetical protein
MDAPGKETYMARKHVYTLIVIAVVCVGLAAYLVIPRSTSAGMAGTVTAVDSAGMATIKTDDGQEHRMTGAGWTVGDKVECAMENDKMACKKS